MARYFITHSCPHHADVVLGATPSQQEERGSSLLVLHSQQMYYSIQCASHEIDRC